MPVANVRGVKINYEILGERGPLLALIAGGRRGYQEFVSLGRKIAAEGFRVLLHDRRNTGASQIIIDGGDGEEEIWADDLAILLRQMDATPAFIGGASSGARMSILVYLRHPEAVRGLCLMRITGGEFAARRLPEMYYEQFIRAAREGGMAGVCATEQYQERIAANPANRDYLMRMDPKRYIEVMSHWRDIFTRGPIAPMMGVRESDLRSIKVPTIIIPGNDKTHSSASGRAAHAIISGSTLIELPVVDRDVPLLMFSDWAEHESAITHAFADFMNRVAAA